MFLITFANMHFIIKILCDRYLFSQVKYADLKNMPVVKKICLMYCLHCVNLGLLPNFLTPSLTVQLQIEEISRRLRTGDLGIPPNPEERFGS